MPPFKTKTCIKCDAVFVPENKEQTKTSICNVCLQEIKESEEEE